MAKEVLYAVVMEDEYTQFYSGDTTSLGMTIPTFTTDTGGMVSYSDIDECYSQINRLETIYPEAEFSIARFVRDSNS